MIPLKISTKVTLITCKNSPKTIKILELRPLWYIENNDVICVNTRMTIDKMFHKCLNKGSKVKIKEIGSQRESFIAEERGWRD